jgi:hypothetical protein
MTTIDQPVTAPTNKNGQDRKMRSTIGMTGLGLEEKSAQNTIQADATARNKGARGFSHST